MANTKSKFELVWFRVRAEKQAVSVLRGSRFRNLLYSSSVQRAALIRVLSAFRTVATATLDVEAHVLPTHLRLRYRAQNTITRLHTLPQRHPIWKDATIVDRSLGSRYRKP
jgi:hypothetical protein